MAFQIKDLLRLKKSGGRDRSGLGITRYTPMLSKQGSVLLLGSFDVTNDAQGQSGSYASRAAGTLLLKRAQMLQ